MKIILKWFLEKKYDKLKIVTSQETRRICNRDNNKK